MAFSVRVVYSLFWGSFLSKCWRYRALNSILPNLNQEDYVRIGRILIHQFECNIESIILWLQPLRERERAREYINLGIERWLAIPHRRDYWPTRRLKRTPVTHRRQHQSLVLCVTTAEFVIKPYTCMLIRHARRNKQNVGQGNHRRDCIVARNFQANHSRHHCNLGVHPGNSKRGSNLSLTGTLSQKIKQRNPCKISPLLHCYRCVIAWSWHFSAHRSHATYSNSPEIVHLFPQIYSGAQKLYSHIHNKMGEFCKCLGKVALLYHTASILCNH